MRFEEPALDRNRPGQPVDGYQHRAIPPWADRHHVTRFVHDRSKPQHLGGGQARIEATTKAGVNDQVRYMFFEQASQGADGALGADATEAADDPGGAGSAQQPTTVLLQAELCDQGD